MGMYDHFYVKDLSVLPLTEREKGLLTTETEWQTKSFDCVLAEIYLTANGTLEELGFDYEEVPKEERPYPDAEGPIGLCCSFRRINERIEPLAHHGYVNFCTNIKSHWIEFVAKFTDGKMVHIERVQPKPDESALW